jgi:hypothetical protein
MLASWTWKGIHMMKPCQPYTNQSTQKKGKQGTKSKDTDLRQQMNHPRGQTIRGTSSS